MIYKYLYMLFNTVLTQVLQYRVHTFHISMLGVHTINYMMRYLVPPSGIRSLACASPDLSPPGDPPHAPMRPASE